MTVRELLVRIGFNMDQSKAKQAEATIEGIKNKAASAVSVITGIGAALGVAFGLDKIKNIADEWTNIDSRIGLVTNSAEEHKQALEAVYDIANRTRQEYTATGDLFTKLSRGSKDFGASQADVLSVTETINKALVVGGASTAEANSTILQLGQALASGRLQGDELRSLSENAPMLMTEVAKAYGVTVGQLKELGKDGQLESKGIFEAILKAKEKMDKEFERMPLTIGQAVTVAGNKFGRFIDKIGKETGVFKSIARGIVNIMDAAERGIEKAAKAVGGFGNLFKIAGAILVALGAAMTYIKWGAIVSGIKAANGALMAFATNPAAWMAMAIAAAVLLLVIALEDLYTWINGGDSIIGEWLGTWEEFRTNASNYIDPLIDGFNRLRQGVQTNVIPAIMEIWDGGVAVFNGLVSVIGPVIMWVIDQFAQMTNNGKLYFDLLLTFWNGIVTGILLALQFWRKIFEGDFLGAIDTVIGFFQNLQTTALSILSQIGLAIGRYVLSKLGVAGEMLAKLAGVDLSTVVTARNAAGVGASGGTSNEINVNVTTPEGTTAAQAEYLEKSAEQSYGGVYNALAYAGGND